MLVVASKYNVLQYAIMIVACMSVPELFTEIEKPQIKPINKQEEDEDMMTTIDIERK